MLRNLRGWSVALLALALTVPIIAQEGHPLKGSWIGVWASNPKGEDIVMVMNWDGKALKIDDANCVKCMHCINAMPKALRPGDDRGATILIGAKAPIIGGALGGPLGGLIGSAAGKIIAEALGVGDVPRGRDERGELVVRHGVARDAERREHAGNRARSGFLRFHEWMERSLKPRTGGTFAIGVNGFFQVGGSLALRRSSGSVTLADAANTTAALCFIHHSFHRPRLPVGVQNHLAIHVTGRPASGLNE